jgi:phenylacetate-CoA ligase
MCALAHKCLYSDNYHIFPEYSYAELIKKDQKRFDSDIPLYEIVGTTFDNYVMPLIRYRTGDYATIPKNKCRCGKNHNIISSICGRKQEFFVDKSNSLITFIYADVPLWDIKEKINAYQYVQNKPGIVILNIEVNNKFSKCDIKTVEMNLKEIYPRFDFAIKAVEKIPKNKNGKFRYLIQNMKIRL